MALFEIEISVSRVLLLTLGTFVIWYLTTAFTVWFRLRHVPGPFLASFSYLWLAKVSISGRQYYLFRDLCKTYGPLVKVAPNTLTTDDPEVLRKIPAARSTYTRDAWYQGGKVNPYHDSIFTILDKNTHTARKAKVIGGLAGREAPLLEAGVDSQLQNLIQLIREKYMWDPISNQDKTVDFALIVSYFTMDVISKIVFGEEFGYLKADADLYEFLYQVREMWPIVSLAADVPLIRNILLSKLFLRVLGPSPTDDKGMGKSMGICNGFVAKRFGPDVKPQRDLLGYWIRNGMTQKDCEADGLFMVLAGSDTTAGTIRITMLYLMTCPQVYQKLKTEIETAILEGKASNPISFDEAKALPYLQAVVYEGLRQRAPAPNLHPKCVPPEGDYIHGNYIPGGTAIGMNISSLLASTTHFGVDADVFRPERFTEASDKHRIEMERIVELAFGYGRFMCAGKPVAFMELNKIFFELLRAFDFQLVNPTKPWVSRCYSVFVEEDMWVKITEC